MTRQNMTRQELDDLLSEIKNDSDSCFDVNWIIEHDNFLFEKMHDHPDNHEFRDYFHGNDPV